MNARQRRWLSIRFANARYYRKVDKKDFLAAKKEVESWNVFRRPDDDNNNRARWDEKDSVVSVMRTRASVWLKKAEGDKPAVGVLLLDPTISKGVGFPLWMGYRNWEPTPSMGSAIPEGPPRDSFYNDFIYWAEKRPFSSQSACPVPGAHSHSNNHVPIEALLHLICADWLTMCEYIKTRLEQINWEIAYPKHFLNDDTQLDNPLSKLHVWRRLVPLYREMLNETLRRVFDFPCHTVKAMSNGGAEVPVSPTKSTHDTNSKAMENAVAAVKAESTFKPTGGLHSESISAFRSDFQSALSYLEEYQQRIDRLTSVVTAVISINDSRRALDENHNVARLTYLATIFIPLSFVATIFSMQEDITKIHNTIKWYFAASIPLCAISLGVVFSLAYPGVQSRVHRGWVKIKGGDKDKKNQ
jgi:Mg2+ and Co2+ transporter CorA